MFQHTVKPGSYVWKFHRPPPRRPPARRSDIVEMDALYQMFEHLEELEDYTPGDLDIEGLNPLEMQFLLMQLGFDPSDSSDDELNY